MLFRQGRALLTHSNKMLIAFIRPVEYNNNLIYKC